jgi:cold-inducible RNA-binding protein
MSAKVFVGNLSFQTTKEELSDFLSEAGTIVDVFLPNDRVTGRPRGFAFVEFASDVEAEAAIERFNGKDLNGRSLNLNPAQDRAPRAPRPPMGAGNMPFDGGRPVKNKGSRRGLRGRKRSL